MLFKTVLLLFILSPATCFDIEEIITEQKYLLELIMVTTIVLLVYNYLIGREKNKQIVKKFVQTSLKTLTNNFFHIGLDMQEASLLEHNYESILDNDKIIEEDSANFFRVYLTGRQNVKFCLTSISTKRRQDLLMSLFYALFWPEKDKVIIECALPSEWEPKGLLYMMRPKAAKKLLNDYEDLRGLCKKYSVAGLNAKQQVVFAEHNDTLEHIFDKNMISGFNEFGGCLESLELSDCASNEIHKGNYIKLIISLNKGKEADFERTDKMIELFFSLIDKLAKYNPSSKTLEKFKENRKKFNSKLNQSQKDEDAQTKRLEKLKNMTPAERRAYDAKQERRQKNMNARRFKVMKKM